MKKSILTIALATVLTACGDYEIVKKVEVVKEVPASSATAVIASAIEQSQASEVKASEPVTVKDAPVSVNRAEELVEQCTEDLPNIHNIRILKDCKLALEEERDKLDWEKDPGLVKGVNYALDQLDARIVEVNKADAIANAELSKPAFCAIDETQCRTTLANIYAEFNADFIEMRRCARFVNGKEITGQDNLIACHNYAVGLVRTNRYQQANHLIKQYGYSKSAIKQWLNFKANINVVANERKVTAAIERSLAY